jgi:hypothetical protein
LFLIESIAMNRDLWPKSAKIAKLDDFIAIERTIMGLINRDLIVDFQAILSTWVDRLLADVAARPALVDEQQKLRGGESILVLNVYISKIYSF